MTGAFGSGCTTAAKHLRDNKGFQYIALSQALKDKWATENPGKEPSRADLQKLGDQLREEKGNGILVDLALKALESDPRGEETKSIVFDGIRNLGEIARLRDGFGYNFTLFAILANRDARWNRIGQSAYTDKGRTQQDFVDDDVRDADEELGSGQQVKLCLDKADILVNNSEDVLLGTYKEKIISFVELLLREKPRSATQCEILMNMAFAASHSSKCLKRHVGALIVDTGGQVVGVGYNENPIGTNPCVEEEEYDYQCYRDIVRNKHFENLAAKRAKCPDCGEPLEAVKGPPWRCKSCVEKGAKSNLESYFFPDRAMSWCTAVHAEVWALLAAGDRARGGTLYTTTFPCFQCAEKITQGRIKKVVFTEAYPDAFSEDRLNLAKIELEQFEGVRSSSFERIFSAMRPD